MSKVGVILTNGRAVDLHPALADHLVKLKRGTYQTTAVKQAPQQTVLTAGPLDLANLTVEQLRDLAKQQGVDVHHRAGAEKIREALTKKADE